MEKPVPPMSLFVACQNGYIENVKLLLNNQRTDVNRRGKYGATPFHVACENGKIEVVKLLLNDERAELDKANEDGATPLFVACHAGHIEIVKLLLASGKEMGVNQKWKNQKTALDVSKERAESTQKFSWETEEEFRKAKRNCSRIAELIESFQKKQEREQKLKGATHKIEYEGDTYILKTTARTLLELKNEIKLKLRIEETINIKLHFKVNEELIVLVDMEDLEDGMTIKVSVSNGSTHSCSHHNAKNDISKSKPSVFLTHTWIKDELNRENHSRVATVNKLLKDQGFQTWFDEDKMVGHIDNVMSEGIRNSDIILVFITHTYMEKVASKGHDNCKAEFTYAITKDKKMVPIVMEPCMKNHKKWDGPLGMRLSGDLYVDMSETGSENDITALVKQLNHIQEQKNHSIEKNSNPRHTHK